MADEKAPEVPFFADRHKRAGLVRRVGNLATRIDGEQSELVALRVLAIKRGTNVVEQSHLRQMMACHLEFISPTSPQEANILARTSGVGVELANLRNLKEDLSNAPEVVRAAFTDIATVMRNSMEAK